MIPKNIFSVTILLMALLLGWPASQTLLAQTTKTPRAVQETFQKKYPRAGEMNWTEIDSLYVVSFFLEHYYVDAFFQKDGAWLESTTYIDQLELPAPVRQIITDRYPGVDLYDSVTKTETPAGLSFQVSFEHLEKQVFLNLDPSGKILGEKADNRR